MVRADIGVSPSVDLKLQKLGYKVADWSPAKKNILKEVKTVLSHSSKQQNGNEGIPDRIYLNPDKKLLILVEEKPFIKDHDNPDITKGAVSGIK